MINEFQGKYRFLSNFYAYLVPLDDCIYASIEHAYQAAKTLDFNERARIRECARPGQAKRLGQQISIRADWESIKLEVMLTLLRSKFGLPPMSIALLATAPQELVEGNYWGDVFWGVCRGVGENHLGKLLMKVREELKK